MLEAPRWRIEVEALMRVRSEWTCGVFNSTDPWTPTLCRNCGSKTLEVPWKEQAAQIAEIA